MAHKIKGLRPLFLFNHRGRREHRVLVLRTQLI